MKDYTIPIITNIYIIYTYEGVKWDNSFIGKVAIDYSMV